MDLRSSFTFLLKANKNLLRCAEVGVRAGENAKEMLQYDKIENLILVDNYIGEEEKHLPVMQERLKPYWDRCTFIHKPSVEAASDVKDLSLDYVYIDADHSYENVKADLTAWFDKVKIGGIFAGHDWWNKEVYRAVFDFSLAGKHRLYAVQHFYDGTHTALEAIHSDWWFTKGMGELMSFGVDVT